MVIGVMIRKPKIVKTSRNTRIECICRIRTADIWYNRHKIGTISEETNDAEEFDWVLRIDWAEWEKSGSPMIAGINTDLRLDEYIRTYVPAFVSERTLPDNRENLVEELERVGLEWNDRFEFMCRTHGLCGVNNITVERQPE